MNREDTKRNLLRGLQLRLADGLAAPPGGHRPAPDETGVMPVS